MRTGPTNPQKAELIKELKHKALIDKSALWKRIALDLEKPTRQCREVNLSRISRNTKPNETIIVPGKVLATGDLGHSLTIAAWSFSKQALQKIAKAKATAASIREIMKDSPKNKKIRIIG